jgi:hypothetical protein
MAGCASDPTLDPTGTWSMQMQYTSGTCGVAVGTTEAAALLISEMSGGQYLVADPAPAAHESIGGTVLHDSGMATINVMINNYDVLNDGGSTDGVIELTATVNGEMSIGGSGSTTLSGMRSCSEYFTLVGTLTP